MAEGRARAGFDLDLKHGECAENALGRHLREGGIEVKRDEKYINTGNLYLEYRCNGKPSGFKVTTSNYAAFEYADDCWLIVPMDKLKKIANEVYRRDEKSRKKGGDRNQTRGVSVPIFRLVRTIALV